MADLYKKLGLNRSPSGNITVDPKKNVFVAPWGANTSVGPYAGKSRSPSRKTKRKKK